MKKQLLFALLFMVGLSLIGCQKTEDYHFEGKTFSSDELSEATKEWLDWYNSLSKEEQESLDYIPFELRPDSEPVITEDAPEEPACGDTAPAITIQGKNYYAPHMPVDELPEGYEYIGDLPKDAANDTGLEGCKMYAVKELDSFPDFYLYQECGTPIDENTVDPSQRQWAYVQWISPDSNEN